MLVDVGSTYNVAVGGLNMLPGLYAIVKLPVNPFTNSVLYSE
jgi:hypothetical protein